MALPISAVLNLRTTASQKCEVFPRGLECEAQRLVYHSTPGSREIKKKKIRIDVCKVLIYVGFCREQVPPDGLVGVGFSFETQTDGIQARPFSTYLTACID